MRLPYLDFPSTVRRGILVLILLIIGIHTLIWFYPVGPPPVTSADNALVQEWLAGLSDIDTAVPQSYANYKTASPLPFYFDPNSLPESGWIKLGLSVKQAQGIRKYIDKGGRFNTPNDLDRIFSLRPDQVAVLKPWVKIAPAGLSPPNPHKANADMLIELNSADSASLEKLPGIGPALASRIIRYRSRLGGFS